MRKLGKIIAGAGAAAKGVRKAAKIAGALAKNAEAVHKILLTGVLIYETIRPKRGKFQGRKDTKGVPPAVKK